jgi:hypothetical protein
MRVGRIWDFEEAAVVNTFDNHNTPDKGVSKLCLLNELDDSLLLVASSEFIRSFKCVVSHLLIPTCLLYCSSHVSLFDEPLAFSSKPLKH